MIIPFEDRVPIIAQSAWVADNALVMGNVLIGENSSIWYGAVARGDTNSITIGDRTNVQDLSVLHVTRQNSLSLGADVTVGHGVILHGCIVKDRVMIGMGSVVLDSATIEHDVIIGAGSLVPPGMTIPTGVLAMGHPVKIVRELNENEVQWIMASGAHYMNAAKSYGKIVLK